MQARCLVSSFDIVHPGSLADCRADIRQREINSPSSTLVRNSCGGPGGLHANLVHPTCLGYVPRIVGFVHIPLSTEGLREHLVFFSSADDRHPDRVIIQNAILVAMGSLPAMLPDPETALLLVCPVCTARYANGLHI